MRTLTIAAAILLQASLAPPASLAECPPAGTVLFPGLSGSPLQDSLRVHFRPPVGLDYGDARDVMFAELDNRGGEVSCIYTGFTVPVNPLSSNPRGDAFNAGLNTEHTWPQSKGAEGLPMQADLHHIFPSEIDANNARAAFPFDEIPDSATDLWYRLRQVVAVPDPGLIDEYSELDRSFPGTAYAGRWEPREARQGDVARAMFYFWTVYRSEALSADPGFFDVQKHALRTWHSVDPADEGEAARTCAIADVQAGRVNPFVIDPTLVDRAYFPEVPVRFLEFRALAESGGVRLVWRTTDDGDAVGFDVLRGGLDPETKLNGTLVPTGGLRSFFDSEGRAGVRYSYWIETFHRDGGTDRFGPVTAVFPGSAPLAATPNPSWGGESVSIRGVAPGAPVLVFDAAGRRVRSGFAAADGQWRWDGTTDRGAAAAPGVYLVRAGDGSAPGLKILRIPK